ncbi:hypothetical protein [Amycolatopsis sp.]|uniref:hypothetical protein n=1 Tax=Amycolatopsis sp. TaxID=37632 RepID=UPI002E07DF87|nr:hypothetical protein [Amycolatopsis sp.]
MVKTKSKSDGKKKEESPEQKAQDKADEQEDTRDENRRRRREDGRGAGDGDFEAVKPEGTYGDGTEIIAVLQPPPAPGGENIQKMVEEAGWQVAAVDWAFEQVTGNSLVQTVIMPITGDFNKIQQNAEAWNTIADSMKQFSATMSGNAEIVGGVWKGKAAEAHKKYVDTGFKLGLTVEAKVAEVIAKGFQSVADVSQRLCAKALDLLKTLVDKVIDAIAKIWIPAYGWVRAAELIWDAYQLYQKIIEIVDLVKETVQKVGEMWNSLQKVGSQLGKIKDIGSFADAKQFAKDVGGAAKDVKSDFGDIKDNVTDIKDTATGVNDTAHQDKVQPKGQNRSGRISGQL